ncbi:MAG TPA: cytochrome oxidase small assembly protein [Burkholderiales bacterium]|nr:cytochrome oxidase small assembly protein [Burkholderiales bacterium]
MSDKDESRVRAKNVRTATILACVAAAFFLAVIVNHWINPAVIVDHWFPKWTW